MGRGLTHARFDLTEKGVAMADGPTARADVLLRAQSGRDDTAAAMRAIRRDIGPEPLALLMLFVAHGHQHDAIEVALRRDFPDTPVMGCTTAGEIGAGGYLDGHIVALGFPAAWFAAAVGSVQSLSDFVPRRAGEVVFDLRATLASQANPHGNEVVFLLADGLSLREEPLAWALSDALGQTPLVGGSAGDGLAFGQTFVLADGRFVTDAAVLAVLRTSCTVTAFRFDHLRPTDRCMVVTDADPSQRLVRQINGMPAAPEYARILGKDPAQLSPFTFAANPVVVQFGGAHHVRAIQRVEPDGTLRFFSAIDTGLVLRLAEGEDIALHLAEQMRGLVHHGQMPDILACDCVLRRLEVDARQSRRAVSDVLGAYGVTGFNTYGEQFNMVHVNQTFTGLAFYRPTVGVANVPGRA